MFYYKTSFSKKAVFLEKTANKSFVGGRDSFGGSGLSGDKNYCYLFCRHWDFKYFSFNNFFKKNKIFQDNSEK